MKNGVVRSLGPGRTSRRREGSSQCRVENEQNYDGEARQYHTAGAFFAAHFRDDIGEGKEERHEKNCHTGPKRVVAQVADNKCFCAHKFSSHNAKNIQCNNKVARTNHFSHPC